MIYYKKSSLLPLIIAVLFVQLPHLIFGQDLLLKGTVIAETSQEPLVGVSIVNIDDENNGTTTNADGSFEFLISGSRKVTIRFSIIGYNTLTYTVADEDFDQSLTIEMSVSDHALDEVLVIGLSEEQQRIKEIVLDVNPVTVISAKEIENRASNLNELLARQAGVQVRQSGGAGSSSSVSIRGLEGKRVQVFLNGNPLNTPDGSFGINDLPLQLIERVEIYKGTVPAELGGDGLGSAVNVVLKHNDYSYIDATFGYQSFGTFNSGLILKKTFNEAGIEWGIGGFLTTAENDFVMESPFQPGLQIKRDHDYYRNILLGSSLKFHKLWFDEIEIEAAYIDYFREIQGIQRNIQHAQTSSQAPVLAINFTKDDFLIDKLNFKSHNVIAGFKAEMIDTSSYSYNWDGSRTLSLIGKGEIGTGPNQLKTVQNEIRSRLNFNYEVTRGLSINLNNAFRRGTFDPTDDLANEFVGRNVSNWPADLTNNIIGFTVETEPANNLLGAISIKHYYSKVTGYNTNLYLQEDPDIVSTKFSQLGYNLGFRYNVSDQFFIKTSHERALRLPNNQELFGDGVLLTPSVSLQPETSYNFNLGVVYDRFLLPSGNRIQAEWNGFLMYVSDLIQLGGNGISTGYVNYAKAKIFGTDLEIKSDITSNLYASINATVQKVIDNNEYIPGTDNVPNPTHELQIPNIPTAFANWNIEYHTAGLLGKETSSRIIYEGSFTNRFNFGFAISAFDNLEIPSFVTHNLVYEQSFQKDKYTLTLEARNLFDAIVINNWNQPLPGRNFKLRVRCLLIDRQNTKHLH